MYQWFRQNPLVLVETYEPVPQTRRPPPNSIIIFWCSVQSWCYIWCNCFRRQLDQEAAVLTPRNPMALKIPAWGLNRLSCSSCHIPSIHVKVKRLEYIIATYRSTVSLQKQMGSPQFLFKPNSNRGYLLSANVLFPSRDRGVLTVYRRGIHILVHMVPKFCLLSLRLLFIQGCAKQIDYLQTPTISPPNSTRG